MLAKRTSIPTRGAARVADEGGFDLNDFSNVKAWVNRVEDALAIAPDEGRFGS